MQEFLRLVNMFTAEGFSERRPVMILNKHIQKYLTQEADFFSKHCIFNSDSENAKKMPQNIYGFLDNLV